MDGRERALAPDALIHLHDETGRGLLAFVELDLGTMSHARLKTKAAGYAAYATQAAWTERHPFCPCLLFLTTTDARAISFLKMLTALLKRQGSGSYYGRRRGYLKWFAAAACAHARDPECAISESCWDDLALAGGGLTLTDCLNKARARYDATRAKDEAEQRARDGQRRRLRANPETRRAYLQESHLRFHDDHLVQFGEAGATALSLLLNATEQMSDVERDAFGALARQLDDDPLEAQAAREPVPPTWTDTEVVASLVDVYRRRQQARVEELAGRYGEGPGLRADRQQLADDGLLGSFTWNSLEQRATRDQEARQAQEALRLAYLRRREREARQRKHEARLAARLAHGRSAVHAIVDNDLLRICRRCDEIVYPPDPERRATVIYEERRQPSRCHFCGGSDLGALGPAYQSELDYGPGKRLVGSDLTMAWIDGSMDGNDNGGGRL